MESLNLIKQRPGKTWWTPILVMILMFVLAGGLGTGLLMWGFSLISGQAAFDEKTASGALAALFGFLFPLLGISLYNRLVNKRSLRALGFAREKWLLTYAKGFALGTVCLLAIVLVATLFGGFKLSVTPQPDWLLLLGLLVGFMVQGLTEEVLCRAYLQNSVAAYKGQKWGIIVSALLFTLLHASNNGLALLPILNLFLFGLVFSLLYALTDNILLVGATHSAWNFMQGPVMGVKVSGNQFATSVLNAEATNRLNLVSGGAFGIEGSILTTIVGLILITWLFKTLERKWVYVYSNYFYRNEQLFWS